MSSTHKVSDLIIEVLAEKGITTVFGVTGGAVVHLFDSINSNCAVDAVFTNHEQSAAFAAEAYGKVSESIGAAIVTTGPGATNALSGVAAAWLDSTPCIFISGQARADQTIRGRNVRQVGSQEIDIVSVVKPITKYAATVYEAADVIYELEKALHIASIGRPGPVWVDIPVDIQFAYVEISTLRRFRETSSPPSKSLALSADDIKLCCEWLLSAQRPVILVGGGVRLASAGQKVNDLIRRYSLPCVQTWAASDFLQSADPQNAGRLGAYGQRGANLTVQNADLVLVLGSHLNSTLVGSQPSQFARDARVILINIDQEELLNCGVNGCKGIVSDVDTYLSALLVALASARFKGATNVWLDQVSSYQRYNHIALDFAASKGAVNSYYFSNQLSTRAGPNDIFVVDGGGTVVYSSLQSLQIQGNQRLILSTGLCSMGSGLPEALGVTYARPEATVHLLIGDGSFPFNMQELALVASKHLSLKIYVFNNEGYVSIRSTQNDFLSARHVGSSRETGLCLPDIKRSAECFNIPHITLSRHESIDHVLSNMMTTTGPIICEVKVSPQQDIVPRQTFDLSEQGSFSPRPLEDMHPLLSRDELARLMIVQTPGEKPDAPKGREINHMRRYPRTHKPFQIRPNNAYTLDKFGDFSNPADGDSSMSSAGGRLVGFGEAYFDGSRSEGYGGYTYNPVYWRGVAQDLMKAYRIYGKCSVLEIGCAKGYLLYEIKKLNPEADLVGVDISEYAVANAHPDVSEFISAGDACKLPFPDRSFDVVIAINTLSELAPEDCEVAIKQIERVSKRNAFITLNAWTNRREKESLMRWNISAKSNFSTNQWKNLLTSLGYSGDYFWTFTSDV